MLLTVAQHYQIMVQLGLKYPYRNCTRSYIMDFVDYSHLILLISGQMFEVTIALEIF